MANSNGNMDPWAVTRDTTTSIGDSAIDARYAIGGLAHPAPGGSGYGFGDGVLPSYMTGSTIGDYLVSPVTPTPGMAATIAPGNAQINRTNNGPYLGASVQVQTVTFAAADATNPRKDMVVLRTMDPGVDTTPSQSWFPVVLQGTPAATPGLPTAQLRDNDLVLATITIRANTNQVLGSDITDSRVFGSARGGVVPKSVSDTRAGAYEGQYRDNAATNALERWDNDDGAWVPVASNATWQPFTPTLLYGGDGANDIAGTGVCNLGTGATASGRYHVVGKIMHLSYSFRWGIAPFNMGINDICTLLPTGYTHRVDSVEMLTTWLYVNQLGVGFAQHYNGVAIISNGSRRVFPMFPNLVINGAQTSYFYRAATQLGVTGASIPPIPGGFPQGGVMNISGVLEIA